MPTTARKPAGSAAKTTTTRSSGKARVDITPPAARASKSTTPTTRARVGARPAPKKAASTARRRHLSPQAMADELRVQTDLAAMDARDQWNRRAAELDQRRQQVNRAIRALLSGGVDASRTLAAGAREAVDELRDAVEAAARAVR